MTDKLSNLKKLLIDTYNRHCSEHHNADFEVCQHPACRVAVAIEACHGLELYLSSSVGDLSPNIDTTTASEGAKGQ